MIIEAIINVIYLAFSALTAVIQIPNMPNSVKEVIATITDYITTGIAIVANYVDMPYLLTLFSIVAVVDVGLMVYKYVMWLIRKLPIGSE